MRPVLGVAVDDGEVSAVLVDADVPQLGPFDSQRWAAEPDVSEADAVARAVTSMAERAENASLTVGAIGLVALPSSDADTDTVVEAIRAASEAPVEVVPLDAARLAYLAGAPELADTPVLALHTRTGGVESASIVDTRSRTVLSSVVRGDDALPDTAALPDAMDEALARTGVSPAALVFLDLRPGDVVSARELSTILGVPFVTPHGVPWHRPTGAALVASRRRPLQPAAAAGAASTRRNLALMAVVVALVAMLGGGLALAMGGSGGGAEGSSGVEGPGSSAGQSERSGTTEFAPETDTPELWDRLAPHPVPRDAETPGDADTSQNPAPEGSDPCGAAQPASWPARGSDPAPSPAPSPTPEPAPEPTPPCEQPVDPAS